MCGRCGFYLPARQQQSFSAWPVERKVNDAGNDGAEPIGRSGDQ